MLEALIRECRCLPKFAQNDKAVTGTITIEGGMVSPLNLLPGQYYWVEGSVLSDGLHADWEVLPDETFTGAVTPLAIPKRFVELAEAVKAWKDENKPSAFQSESFGGYSYTIATGKNGGQITWQEAFAMELREWRMI